MSPGSPAPNCSRMPSNCMDSECCCLPGYVSALSTAPCWPLWSEDLLPAGQPSFATTKAGPYPFTFCELYSPERKANKRFPVFLPGSFGANIRTVGASCWGLYDIKNVHVSHGPPLTGRHHLHATWLGRGVVVGELSVCDSITAGA